MWCMDAAGYATSAIADDKRHVGASRDVRLKVCRPLIKDEVVGFNQDFAARWHGIASVDYQVYDHLIHLPRIGFHIRQPVFEIGVQCNIFAN